MSENVKNNLTFLGHEPLSLGLKVNTSGVAHLKQCPRDN